jgi:hypothetical protein
MSRKQFSNPLIVYFKNNSRTVKPIFGTTQAKSTQHKQKNVLGLELEFGFEVMLVG